MTQVYKVGTHKTGYIGKFLDSYELEALLRYDILNLYYILFLLIFVVEF